MTTSNNNESKLTNTGKTPEAETTALATNNNDGAGQLAKSVNFIEKASQGDVTDLVQAASGKTNLVYYHHAGLLILATADNDVPAQMIVSSSTDSVDFLEFCKLTRTELSKEASAEAKKIVHTHDEWLMLFSASDADMPDELVGVTLKRPAGRLASINWATAVLGGSPKIDTVKLEKTAADLHKRFEAVRDIRGDQRFRFCPQ